MNLSIVIPLFNEEENILSLVHEIMVVLFAIEGYYEIILVNDGSNDNTEEKLKDIQKQNLFTIKTISYTKNRGQGLAIRAGLEMAKGNYVAILDGDMQFDPKDILRFYTLILKGHDLICGVRKKRKDSVLINTLPSKIGNWLIARIFKTKLNDIGCALKIADRQQMLKIRPFKNYHRYLSVFLITNGAQYCQLEVIHRKRKTGKTKYSGFKFIGVIKEIFWIKFFYDPFYTQHIVLI